jgi:hypothetical protein
VKLLRRRASWRVLALAPAYAAAAGACFDWTVPEGGSSGAGRSSGGEGEGGDDDAPSVAGAGGAGAGTSASGGGGAVTTAVATGTTSAVTTGAGGAPVDCDTLAGCDACAICAEEGPCQAIVDACYSDPECLPYQDCLDQCFDQLCLAECDDAYPSGSQHWWDAAHCVDCDACPSACAPECASLG